MLTNLQEIRTGGAERALHRLWSDDLTEPEATAIQARAGGDPKYREELVGLFAAFDSIGGLEGDRAIEEVTGDYQRLIHERRSKSRLALGIAAAFLVAVNVIFTYFWTSGGPDDSHLQKYYTRIGEQQTIGLADGSVVTLNTAGQLVADYSGTARRILLERGEAYFDVASDPNRPFTVDLGVRSVTVVGTEFSIRKDPQRYEVAVIEGAVSIGGYSLDSEPANLPSTAQQRVEAGWVAEFDVQTNELKAFQPESMDRYVAWRNGMVTFAREPLYRVVQELNRYSRKKILIEDTAVMELSVYVIVDVHEIDAALDGLSRLLPIEVAWHYDRIVITGSAEKE